MKKVSALLCVFALLLVGVCNGETKTEHWPNGQKRWEFNYQDGKKHGPWTVWYENGQKESECNYVRDQIEESAPWLKVLLILCLIVTAAVNVFGFWSDYRMMRRQRESDRL